MSTASISLHNIVELSIAQHNHDHAVTWYVIGVPTHTVLRDVSTGAVETRISNLQNQKAKNEQKQSRNRKQSRRNKIEGKKPLKFLHKNFQNVQKIQIQNFQQKNI